MRLRACFARGGTAGRRWSAFRRAVALTGCLAVVGACVGGPGASRSDLAQPPNPLTRYNSSAEGIEIAPVEGAPAPMAKLLQRSVAAALARYNVPASYSAEGGGRYRLAGVAGSNADPAQAAAVAIEWRVFDRRAGRETGRFTLPVIGDRFAWDFGDPRVIAQVGEGTSTQLIAMIDGATPVAVNHGPGDIARAGDVASAASAPPPQPTRAAPVASPRDVSSPAGPTVFLARVGGAPGDGDAALARATRAALAVGGLDVAARREDARYIVAGSVTVADARAGRQPVRIVWEVSAPDGRPLGRAVQENAVAAGILDGAWGSMASLVASAAVAGIADVIRRAGESPRASNEAPLPGRAEESAARSAPRQTSERRLKVPAVPDVAGLPVPTAKSFAAADGAPSQPLGRSP